MRKRLLALILIICLCSIVASNICYAHDSAEEHNKELEKVLFEEGFSKYKSDEVKRAVRALELASYLSIDQFHGNGESQFDELKRLGYGGFLSFSSIDYYEDLTGTTKNDGTAVQISAQNHRKYTHQGWEMNFQNDNVNKFMEKRRSILLGTVNSVFGFRKVTFLIGYDERCKSLSGIIYYVHILGDYAEADKYTKISLLPPLAGNMSKDPTKEALIPSLKKYIETLFADQQSDDDYKDLLKGLEKIEKEAFKIEDTIGGVNTDEEFEKYHNYSTQVLELLMKHIPNLLKEEQFFSDVFYSEKAA
ncbi:hypothetical protein bpr_I1876 [Butyrivibrio proteoclasticus B316]|uniref:Uncharacterized protein n=1 Tax=Butyrivibrio proteoclasticus (strain ATCC 51982 / DSM 14932 / B316) TaxID=515622 RepID=E0RWT4_BUTPB|nr:hypothetical protein [Butyrivibrio proteoclasticus]ADL34610.1 hypothetical protein bpr_I1876 [Butyrivibrio proteoclasticus B316]